MKLRLRENSIRVRLLRGEIDTLRENGSVEEAIHFGPDAKLVYEVCVAPHALSIHAIYTEGRITIQIPSGQAAEWTTTALVGLEQEQPAGHVTPLTILLEKDFACFDRKDDPDNKDAFPHPKSNC